MDVDRFEEVAPFLERAGRVLFENRARHNLILGVAQTVAYQPDVFDGFVGWVAWEGDLALAAAVRTPPHKLILADAVSIRGLHALTRSVAEDIPDLPGVVGNRPSVSQFAELWSSLTGAGVVVEMDQGVFMLEEVVDPPAPGGGPRVAAAPDLDLVVRWWRDFTTESIPGEGLDATRAGEIVGRALDPRRPQGVWLWEDGRPVSMAGHSPPAFRGVRIGPVYTPPESRGRGYASALVAALSRHLLENGHDFCYLYTDLANPTSNAIYERIGYRQVAGSAQIRFDY